MLFGSVGFFSGRPKNTRQPQGNPYYSHSIPLPLFEWKIWVPLGVPGSSPLDCSPSSWKGTRTITYCQHKRINEKMIGCFFKRPNKTVEKQHTLKNAVNGWFKLSRSSHVNCKSTSWHQPEPPNGELFALDWHCFFNVSKVIGGKSPNSLEFSWVLNQHARKRCIPTEFSMNKLVPTKITLRFKPKSVSKHPNRIHAWEKLPAFSSHKVNHKELNHM